MNLRTYDHPANLTESLVTYLPMDRRQAIARGEPLPAHAVGTALFADISGFTPLTEALAQDYGPQRGAEELTWHLNRVYDALITQVDRYRGSVVSFSGDAITCWFEAQAKSQSAEAAQRAVACALAMQQAIQALAAITIPSGAVYPLALKIALATGSVRRFLVGDPDIQIIDTLAGLLVDRLATAEHLANKGEILADRETIAACGQDIEVTDWRCDISGQPFGVICPQCDEIIPPSPWPPLPGDAILPQHARPWLLPPVYERLAAGQGEFLAELRPVVSFFLNFSGVDFESDPESAGKLDLYVRQVQQILAGYEAALIQLTIGDKGSYLQAAFGAPIAHEDDAHRALSAALDLHSPGIPFIRDVRMGLSKGRMRTGAYGSTNRRTYGMMGDDVNLAARLMQAARPGQILVSPSVCQGIEEDFIWENLPDLYVKGKTKAVRAFALLGRRERTGEPQRAFGYSLPMIGRQAELQLVREKIDKALQGQGQVIGITGEAGVGKSRLVAEIIDHAAGLGIQVLNGECQSYGTNTSYLVWQSIWRQFWGLSAGDSPDLRLSKLEQALASVDPALVSRLPLLGSLLDFTIPDNPLTATFDAKLRKISLEAMLLDCLRAQAAQTPLLVVLDDLQWIDPLSHELLEVISRAVFALPVVILLAYRPPLAENMAQPRVIHLPHFTQLNLNEFSPDETRQLVQLKIRSLFQENPADLSEENIERTAQLITERAEGNPFYIEELLNYLHDQGKGLSALEYPEGMDLPTSLQSLILSRIDQLQESQKLIIKLASVIGRLFRAALLWGAYPQIRDQTAVLADLQALARADLITLDTPEPELIYLFKHILTQEVAYESLPYATRALLHEQIAGYIESTSQSDPDRFVDLLAFHYDRSNNLTKKRDYLIKAGEIARRQYANKAAIDYFSRALPLLADTQRIDILLKLGKVLELVGRWEEASEAYHSALQLAHQLKDVEARAWCLTAQGDMLRKQGKYSEAGQWLSQALDTFEDLNNEAGIGQVLHSAGTLSAQQGDFEEARTLYERSLTIRRKLQDMSQIASLLSNLGIVARILGNIEKARTLYEESLAIRRKIGDKWALAVSLINLGNVALDQKNLDEARVFMEEALALQREVGDRWSVANALNNLGNLARTQGDYTRAMKLYRESLEIYQEFGDKRALAYLLEDIGALAALEDQPRRALRLVGAASALRQEIGSPLSAREQEALDGLLEKAHAALAEIDQAMAIGQGRSLSQEEAIRYAMEGSPD